MPEKHTGESSTSESGSSAVHACGSKGEEGRCQEEKQPGLQKLEDDRGKHTALVK